MSAAPVEIVACPPARLPDALAIVLRELAPEQRREIADEFQREATNLRTLFVAVRDGELLDAAWGQLQPGNTAIFWPPQGVDATAQRLTQAVADALDRVDVCMTQVLLSDGAAGVPSDLERAGFHRLAELLYLSWDTSPDERSLPASLEFEPFQASQLARLTALVEATYAGTQDCPAMNGQRPMHEVIAGYRATGVFRPENWLFVRAAGEDVGVLLLADHRGAKYWELVYMGLRPEFRGRALGREIVRQAQRMVRAAGVERMLVAVDAANRPALEQYRHAGFSAWDQRTVFVRFHGGAAQI